MERSHRLAFCPRELLRRLGFGEARRNAVHGDPVTAHLFGQRLAEADHPGLRHRVERDARHAGAPGVRNDVDDAPPRLLLHPLDDRPRAVERPDGHDVHRELPEIVVRALEERAAAGRRFLKVRSQRDAGVVHQDVHAAPPFGDLLYHRAHGGGVRHVAGDSDGLATGLAYLLSRGHSRTLRDVVDRDSGALLSQRVADLPADALAGAGDQRHASTNAEIHATTSVQSRSRTV